MDKKDEDKLLKAIDRSLNPTIQLTEHLSIQPNIPGSQQEWTDPLATATDQISATLKPNKRTTLKLTRRGDDGVELTFTKKF